MLKKETILWKETIWYKIQQIWYKIQQSYVSRIGHKAYSEYWERKSSKFILSLMIDKVVKQFKFDSLGCYMFHSSFFIKKERLSCKPGLD